MGLKPQVYKDERPAEYFTRFHERTRRRRPDYMYGLVRMGVTPYLLLVHRTRVIDTDKIPPEGPVIIAPNHFSFVDHFFVAAFIRREVHFMAKSQLFKRPMQFVYDHGGVFPVLRGRRDEEAFKTAHTVLGRGDLIVMYTEGGRSRTGDLGEAKPGIGRLALETGATVVPTAIYGSQHTRHWSRGKFPKVTVRYGDPIKFDQVVESPTREQSQAAADVVMERIAEVYEALRRDGRRAAVRDSRAARAARGAAERAGERARGRQVAGP
jgi:1-acyl-sn-glycerol-3-phosphate acyltransferase